jgi:hypothetical protein
LTYKTVEEIKLKLNAMIKVINPPQDYLPTHNWSEGSGRPHIEVHSNGYHFIVTERGNEFQRKVTQDLDELLYWAVSCVTHPMASQYELKHRIPNQDFRKLMFQKDIELLTEVKVEFAIKRQSEIEQTLEKHPYNDLTDFQFQEASAERSFESHYSNIQPIWHLIVLTVITIGFYQIVWFYKTWKQLRNYNNWDLSYVYRTVFTFIPIIGFIIVVNLFNRIKRLIKQNDINNRIYPVLSMIAFYILNALFRLPKQYWLLGFLSVLPIAHIQYALNNYWGKVQVNHLIRRKFTKRQWVLVVIGSFYWILIIIGLFQLES